jgi:hypothetical protein
VRWNIVTFCIWGRGARTSDGFDYDALNNQVRIFCDFVMRHRYPVSGGIRGYRAG